MMSDPWGSSSALRTTTSIDVTPARSTRSGDTGNNDPVVILFFTFRYLSESYRAKFLVDSRFYRSSSICFSWWKKKKNLAQQILGMMGILAMYVIYEGSRAEKCTYIKRCKQGQDRLASVAIFAGNGFFQQGFRAQF